MNEEELIKIKLKTKYNVFLDNILELDEKNLKIILGDNNYVNENVDIHIKYADDLFIVYKKDRIVIHINKNRDEYNKFIVNSLSKSKFVESNVCCSESNDIKMNEDRELPTELKIDGFVLVMKGNKNEPKCKFSKAAVNTLNEKCIEYTSINILEDSQLRQDLKVYCPTYPQLWKDGKFYCKGDDILNVL